MKRLSVVLGACLILLGISSGISVAATVTVEIDDFDFDPETVTINVGDTVRWVNVSDLPQTTTSGDDCDEDGVWDSDFLDEDESFEFTFNTPGTYDYFSKPQCFLGMTGRVIVQGDEDANIPDPDAELWHSFFAVDSKETPMIGDFNGDGRTDIITFTRDNPQAIGDVYVALSNGSQFGASTKWHDWFAINDDETVLIGDFNGDDIDDIATWLRTTSRQVYVALSTGSGMEQNASIWINSIGGESGDTLQVGDADGDGIDDLILFSRGVGQVRVALSNGTEFLAPTVWHNFFAVSADERPRVGDLNGDNLDDIITFATDNPRAFGDVYAALSDGNSFDNGFTSEKWNDFFGVQPAEIIRIEDLNGDGLDDFITFMPPPNAGQVYVSFSEGTGMTEPATLFAENFATSRSDEPFVGDANGDGQEDLILFRQSTGTVWVRPTTQ